MRNRAKRATMKRLKLLRPINRKTAEELATEELRDYIISGKSRQGERIVEQQLSAKLQVSRATIRAALHQLMRDGLVTLTRYSGWYVKDFDARDINELFSLRESLEGLATRKVAETRTRNVADTITRAFAELEESCRKNNRERAAQADFNFHAAIVDLAGHSRLASIYTILEHQIRFVVASSDALITDRAELVEQHRPIYEAILNGDAKQAFLAATHHVRVEGARLEAHVAKLDALKAESYPLNQRAVG